jgi:hypothetical protein
VFATGVLVIEWSKTYQYLGIAFQGRSQFSTGDGKPVLPPVVWAAVRTLAFDLTRENGANRGLSGVQSLLLPARVLARDSMAQWGRTGKTMLVPVVVAMVAALIADSWLQPELIRTGPPARGK